MPRQSALVESLATLNFVYSLFHCLCWGGACLGVVMPGHSPTDRITRNIPEYMTYAEVQAWTGIFMSLWLIFASLRLLHGERGGRMACIFYSVYVIVAQLGGALVAIHYVQPAIAQHELEHGMPPGALSRPELSVLWMVIMLHAVILLAAMIRYDETAYLIDGPASVPRAPEPPEANPG